MGKNTVNIAEIIGKYTNGEATLEETNQALRDAGSMVTLEPGRNELTEEEIRATTIGQYPDMANGWGLLDTGTGSFDKVEVRNGKLVSTGCGIMKAMICMAGRWYYIDDKTLCDEEPDYPTKETVKLPSTPDMSRRTDLADKTAVQSTAHGKYEVTYNESGYAVKATKI